MPDIAKVLPRRAKPTATLRVTHLSDDAFLVGVDGHTVLVDQPSVEGDLGPTPVELFVASLATCVALYAGRYLRRHALPLEGLGVEADWSLSDLPPTRVASIHLRLLVPAGLSELQRRVLLQVTRHCTVHNSLRQVPEVEIELLGHDLPATAGAR